ncbi:MAG: metallophosphoesterase [Lachnospiraceae bacterium]|nr:metallophosphoesterase [Lachnospiraceae bacterium]
MRKIDTTIYNCHDERLPEKARGLRIAVLADLHNNRFGPNDEDLLAVTRDFAPDLILMPGDLVVGRRGESDYEPMIYLCRNLRRIAPVYVSPGNHEQCLAEMGGRESAAYRAFLGRLWERDVEMLENGSILTPYGIRIYGLALDMSYYKRGRVKPFSAADLDRLIGMKDPEEFVILMAHDPVYFPAYALWGANLTVSGHQHGGMFRLPGIGGVISPQLSLFPKYDAGEYHAPDAQMILSRGLGSHHVDLRFLGNAPEFVGIVLDK